MDKKFLLKAILLNTAWVAWIVISIFLGYIIYREAFPTQPIVIIPFSLLFLAAGGAVVYVVNKFLKKRNADKAKLNSDANAEGMSGTESQSNDIVAEPTVENIAISDIENNMTVRHEDISEDSKDN